MTKKRRPLGHKPSSYALVSPCLCDSLRSVINMGSYLLLDQSLSGFQSQCQFAPSVDVCLWMYSGRWPSDVPQLSAARMEEGFEVSEGAASLSVSTESSCMESVASCTASLSSETQRQYSWVPLCFSTDSSQLRLRLAIDSVHAVSCSVRLV